MLKRKHIRAPATFDPGPGHPRERLAYLNDAEMQMLRALTDGRSDPGPQGIPSFAVTSGTTSGTTMGGGSSSSKTGGSSGPGGIFGPARQDPSTGKVSSGTSSVTGGGGKGSSGTSQNNSPKSPSGPSGPNSGASTGKTAGGVSAPSATSGLGGSKSPSTTSAKAPSTPSSPMGGQGSSFSSSAAASAYNRGVTTRSTPTPASPMGGQGSSFSRPSAAAEANRRTASAIKGGSNASGSSKTASAIAGSNISRYPGQGTTPLTGAPRGPYGPDRMAPNVGTDFNQTLRREAQDIGVPNAYADNSLEHFNDWATDSFSRFAGVPRNVAEQMTRTVVGEAAGEGLVGQSAVAKVMENRLKYGDEYGRRDFGSYDNPTGMLGGFDANGIQRARTGGPNEGYKQATPNSPQYGRAAAAMADSLDPYGSLATTHPEALNATHYVTTSAEPDTYWTRNSNWQGTRTQIGNHVFGNPENTVSKMDALNQRSMPGAAARTQAYQAANPPAMRGALQPASYSVPSALSGVRAQAAPAPPEPVIYNGLKSIPGAISGLGRGIKAISDTISTPNPDFKRAAGMIASSNPLVSGAAKIAAGQLVGPAVKEWARSTIQGLKDTFDPNNPRAQRDGGTSTERRGSTAGTTRSDERREEREARSGSKTASATKKGGRNPEQGKGGDNESNRQSVKKETPAERAKRIGKKKIEDLTKPEPKAADWSSYTNVMTREQALRKLLGEEWYA